MFYWTGIFTSRYWARYKVSADQDNVRSEGDTEWKSTRNLPFTYSRTCVVPFLQGLGPGPGPGHEPEARITSKIWVTWCIAMLQELGPSQSR
jgi:hypothetical protein